MKNKQLEIGDFFRNSQEKVIAKITEYQGKKYFDLRVYYKTEDGLTAPTKKGITIALDLLPQLKKLILEAEKEVSKLGEK